MQKKRLRQRTVFNMIHPMNNTCENINLGYPVKLSQSYQIIKCQKALMRKNAFQER